MIRSATPDDLPLVRELWREFEAEALVRAADGCGIALVGVASQRLPAEPV